MNYRHAYHAGNFADILKHAILTQILQHLLRKDTPFRVIDTHAGIGIYDLSGEEAQKTGEYRQGIVKLLAGDAPPGAEDYLDSVRALNEGGDLRRYPGSPWIARRLLRDQDKLMLVELHPEDKERLHRIFARDPRVSVHHMDAYTALKSFLPPPERRGLVLIDPPFEVRDEFERITQSVGKALERWKTGIYAIWYPIKTREQVDRFLAQIGDVAEKAITAELLLRPAENPIGLSGCGIVIINPPWQLEETLRAMLPALLARLDAPQGSWDVRSLAGD